LGNKFDDHSYLQIENDMKELVLRSPLTSYLIVSLTGNLGVADEPAEYPGLHHFIEHLILISKKKRNLIFMEFIANNPGYINAQSQ
jgi:secreted Zn-dependent insulinase-like peptidase